MLKKYNRHMLSIQPFFDYDKYCVVKRQNQYFDLQDKQGKQGKLLKHVLSFTVNDTLNLSQDDTVIAQTISAIKTWGSSSASSTAISGYSTQYKVLQSTMKRFKGFKYNPLFINAYMALSALFEALCYQTIPYAKNAYKKSILIISDINNHSCIHTTLKYVKAIYGPRFRTDNLILEVKKCDIRNLKTIYRKLKTVDTSKTAILFVADSVFSMDGNILPLPEIIRIFEPYQDVTLILDSAHATANLGKTGRGILEYFNLSAAKLETQGVDIIVLSTLSKCGASAGAVISTNSSALCELMKMSLFYVNTTSLAPGLLASANSAIEMIMTNPGYITQLQTNTKYARSKLIEAGFTIAGDTHIIPIFFTKDKNIIRMVSNMLIYQHKIWIVAVSHVASPRLRVVINRLHTTEEIDRLVDALKKVRVKLALPKNKLKRIGYTPG